MTFFLTNCFFKCDFSKWKLFSETEENPTLVPATSANFRNDDQRTTWGACMGEQSNACNRFCWHHIWLCLSNDWFCQGCKGSQHFSHKVIFSSITVAQDLNGRTNAADISPKIVHICEERSLLLAGIPLLPPISLSLSLSPDAIVSAPVNHDLCHLGGERGERERGFFGLCSSHKVAGKANCRVASWAE